MSTAPSRSPLARNQLAAVPTALILSVSRDELVLADHWQTTTVRGERDIREHLVRLAARHPAGAILYAAGWDDYRALRKLYPKSAEGRKTDQGPQSLTCLRWPTVYFWKALGGTGDRQAAWYAFEDHCRSHGVVPKTVGRTALDLWHNTGGNSYQTSLNGHLLRDVVRDRLIYGARDHAIRYGLHHGARYLDLIAAYPSAMVAGPFPLKLRRGSNNPPPQATGIAQARVRVPELRDAPIPNGQYRGPIPWRTAEGRITFPTKETLAGWWTLAELRFAEETGCEVERFKTFVGDDYQDVFGRWFAEVYLEGRSLPHDAARLAKQCGNALWGALKNDQTKILWTAEVTARVRIQVARALYTPGLSPLYADTDGIIANGDATLGPEWAQKEWAGTTSVKILRTGSYAYRTETGLWKVSSERNLDLAQFNREYETRFGATEEMLGP